MSAKTKVLAKRHKQGSANQTDFHIFCSVFHADSHGAILFFSKMVINYHIFRITYFRVDIFKRCVGISWSIFDMLSIFFLKLFNRTKQTTKKSFDNGLVANTGE